MFERRQRFGGAARGAEHAHLLAAGLLEIRTQLDAFGQQKFETTLKELQDEREAVKDLLG